MQNHLIALEKSLLTLEVRSSWEQVEALLHDDFYEIAQSGTSFGKQEVLIAFRDGNGTATKYDATDFTVHFIAPTVAQVRYQTVSIPKGETENRTALRTSLWTLQDGRWQMIFHQGTIKKTAS